MAEENRDATPAPSDEETKNPQQDAGEATPQEGGESTPISQTEGEGETPSQKVAELQAKIEQLQKEVEHARNMQSIADRKAREERRARIRLQKELKRLQAEKGYEVPETEISTSENVDKILVRGRVAELLLRNKEYQQILDKDPTLKEVLLTNPLALVEDAVDVEDAVEQIKDKIESRIKTLQSFSGQKKEEKKIEAGAVQPPENRLPDEEIKRQEALKRGDIEGAILSRIKTS